MCGITGVINHRPGQQVEEGLLRQMLAMLRHRGPDQFGIYVDEQVGLGSARLSIIDLSSGQQPISNEDETLWIVFNGEIFNYVELRPALEARGHHFATNSDTEVILHLYEDYGPDCLSHLNGQFAIAIWDTRRQSLFLARDRVGIRPIFYTETENALVFGSEIKAILAYPGMQAELDPAALDDIFSYWSPQSPRTAFKGIYEVPPGSYMLVRNGEKHIQQYWRLQYPDTTSQEYLESLQRPEQDYLAEFRDLLIDATQIRLRADVPVGAYLSGGLDSSTITAIIRKYTGNRLDTFSISFADAEFDESDYQRRMAQHLGTDHQVVYATHADIGRIFPDVIWHTETPVTRTSPAPMYLLSGLVRDHNFKVVLTGEGADEFLGGYDIFKEAKIRRFWARQPDSQARQLLLQKLHPHIKDLSSGGGAYLAAFFKEGLTDLANPFYSHDIRWKTTQRTKRFFSTGLVEQIQQKQRFRLDLPAGFASWHPLAQAQYIEITTFMSTYLLSSQGDRVGMAHSVEGRFPFLDMRLMEFCNRLPAHLKLQGLTEKYLLKKLAREWLPDEIWKRHKQPYRAPIHRSFFNEDTQDYVDELLSPAWINKTGFFKADAVQQLVEKVRRGTRLGETDDMALAGILSTQLVYYRFVEQYQKAAPLAAPDDVKVCYKKIGQGAKYAL